jgi:hypothetical protein
MQPAVYKVDEEREADIAHLTPAISGSLIKGWMVKKVPCPQ